ncbi:hypothetical protein L6R52_13500 [Myxococcota bacterium]|nr:hypothetical protein [Myxococcota bacterium]
MKTKSLFVALALSFGLVACDEIITVEEAALQFGEEYCQKLQECYGEAFLVVYPSGVNQCTDTIVASIPEADRGKTSACIQSELDACMDDVRALMCTATPEELDLPSSCGEC